MTRAYRVNKRDANEKEIVSLWRGLGYTWVQMRPGQGFDGLLVTPQGIYIIEIKNPARRWQLEECERELAMSIEMMGQRYHIIESVDDALKLIGAQI